MDELKRAYPWTSSPMVSSAPMRLIAHAKLAVEVSNAGGLGFIGAGSDISSLAQTLSETRRLLSQLPQPLATANDTLPVGIGFLIWGAPLDAVVDLLRDPTNIPSAVWLFAPRSPSDLSTWTTAIRTATSNKTAIWIQVGNVADAVHAAQTCAPDVLVIQGQDAGGHGLSVGAGLVPLLPECMAAVQAALPPSSPQSVYIAAGGISTGAQAASALTLGASGVCLGTRYLASPEAEIAPGYRAAVLRARDGGHSTVRSSVYDMLRGTTGWPAGYGARGVINASYTDALGGMSAEENKRLYEAAVAMGDAGWDEHEGRMTTYAGAGVGLVESVMPAADITREVREEAVKALRTAAERVRGLP